MQHSNKHPKGFASKFRVYLNHIQAIPTAIGTTIELGDGIDFDTLQEFNPVTYQFTPSQAGYYVFHATMALANLNIGDSYEIRIVHNGVLSRNVRKTQGMAGWEIVQVQDLLYMLPTDTIEITAWHNFGANRNLIPGNIATVLDGFRVS